MSVILKGPKGARRLVLASDDVGAREVNMSLATYESWLTGSFLSRKIHIAFDQLKGKDQFLNGGPVFLSSDFSQFLTRDVTVRQGEEVVDRTLEDRRLVDINNWYFSPVNVDGNHWVLLVVKLGPGLTGQGNKFIVYDSLHPTQEGQQFSPFQVYGEQLVIIKDWFTENLPEGALEDWEVSFGQTEHQGNNYDCGIWVFLNFRRVFIEELMGMETDSNLSSFQYRRAWRTSVVHRDYMPCYKYIMQEAGPLVIPSDQFLPIPTGVLKQSGRELLKQQLQITLDAMKKIESVALPLFDSMWICGARIGVDTEALQEVTSDRLQANFTGIQKQILDFKMDYLDDQEFNKFRKIRLETVEKFVQWYFKKLMGLIKYRDLLSGLIATKTVSTIKDLREAPINLGGTWSSPIELGDDSDVEIVEERSPRKFDREPSRQSVKISTSPVRVEVSQLPPPLSQPKAVKWPKDENSIDVKLMLIENWVRDVYNAKPVEKAKPEEGREKKMIKSQGDIKNKRDREDEEEESDDSDEDLITLKLKGSGLVLDDGIWVNKPTHDDIFKFNLVDKESRINKLSETYQITYNQIRRTRKVLESKSSVVKPDYIRSSVVSCVCNDAFRVIVLTDRQIYDSEVGLPPKYKMKDGRLEAVRRLSFKQDSNPSWDTTVLSHNEAMVVAARFNSYYVVLALLKLYVDRRMISTNAGQIDDPNFILCDFDLFWKNAKALKIACQYGAYETVLVLLNPIVYRLSVVSGDRRKSYLSEALEYRPVEKMWERFSGKDADKCRELLGAREITREDNPYREALRKKCITRLNQLRPRVKPVVSEIELMVMSR